MLMSHGRSTLLFNYAGRTIVFSFYHFNYLSCNIKRKNPAVRSLPRGLFGLCCRISIVNPAAILYSNTFLTISSYTNFVENQIHGRTLSRPLIWLILLVVLGAVLFSIVPLTVSLWLWQKLAIFATVFLGIFIEAVPFLLMGTLASGLVEAFLSQEWITRISPQRALPAAVLGSLLGLVFPVCECGVIPLTRRLFRKGLPVSTGIAFLLAAPVINPIVIFSTAAAFGWGRMLAWRLGLTLIIAVTIGIVFSAQRNASDILRQPLFEGELPVLSAQPKGESIGEKLSRALIVSTDEFFEMGRYLIMGASLAAIMQTFIPQTSLLAVGSGPLLSVIAMLTLAVVLSICSTVDAFIALGFVGTFSFGSILSFLVFGPMVDIKSMLMYLQVFRRRPVFYLVLLPLLISLLAGITFNYLSP